MTRLLFPIIILLRYVPNSIKGIFLRLPLIRILRDAMYTRIGKNVVAIEPFNFLLQLDFTKPDQRGFFMRVYNYEPEVKQFILQTVKSGDVVIDVGAHIGYYTLLLSNLVGENGIVIAFEPFLDNAEAVRTNVRINERNNVIVESIGLADFTGTANLYIPTEAWQASAVRSVGRKVSAEFITFDEYVHLHSRDFAKVNLIKIDVEGAELQVVMGMRSFLRSYKPQLLIEFNSEEEYEKVKAFLKQHGYNYFKKIGEAQYGFWIFCHT